MLVCLLLLFKKYLRLGNFYRIQVHSALDLEAGKSVSMVLGEARPWEACLQHAMEEEALARPDRTSTPAQLSLPHITKPPMPLRKLRPHDLI